MTNFKLYYRPRDLQISPTFSVESMGINELMQPQELIYAGAEDKWLIIFFHTQANSFDKPSHKMFSIWSPNTTRKYGNKLKSWRHSWLVLQGKMVKEHITKHSIATNTPIDINAASLFEHYFALFERELTNHIEQNEYMLEQLFDIFLYELNRLQSKDGVTIPLNIKRAEDFIVKNLSRDISLEDIANESSLSISRLIPLYKSFYGESPMRYLYRKRMNLAAQLLNFHYYTCKEVSEKVGYKDALNFSRRFKQYWGIAPTLFKEHTNKAIKNAIKSQ